MAMNVDQNFSVYFDGVKTNGKKKRGGLGGRKALTDISNSGNPPALNTRSRKQNPKNVMIPIGEDLGGFKKKTQVSGRKALSDLTNSVKPSTQSLKKKNEGKNSINVAEEEFLHNHDESVISEKKLLDLDFNLEDEGFCHDHDICVKLQEKSLELDFDQFFQGLDEIEGLSKDEDVRMFDEMEEIPEMEEVEVPEFPSPCFPMIESPMFGSPISSTMSDLLDYDDLPLPCFAALPIGSK